MDERIEALVFDYDGVLADTEPLHWKSWAALLSQYGIEYGWDEYCLTGRGVHDSRIREAFAARIPGFADFKLADWNRDRKQMVREWSLARSPIPPETIEMLATLGAFRVGLVTSSDAGDVEPILKAAGIHERFDAMVFGGDVSRLKPAPDPYLLIAQKLGVKTGIAFEDSAPGLESARAAGFKVIAIEQPGELARIVAQLTESHVT